MKLLSIILPTYNGGYILPYTLSLLKEQVLRNKEDLEFVICNNASNDDTKKVLQELKDPLDFFSIVDYNEHVGIGESISRSIENAKGKYVLLWSDDDIPSPTMIDVVLSFLKRFPDVALLHFNRLTGYTKGEMGIGSLKVYNNFVDKGYVLYDDIEKFAVNHYQGMDFLSCDVIRKDAWDKGLDVYTKNHCGYEFIVPMLYGAKGEKCLYIEYPLCVHRASKRPRWIIKLPLYWLIGAPRMIKDMEKLGIISNWEKVWHDSYYYKRQLKSFVGIIINCTLDKSLYKPLINELCSYQESKVKRLIAKLIINFCPRSFYERRLKKKYGESYVMDKNGSFPLIP